MRRLGFWIDIALMAVGLAILSSGCGNDGPWYDTEPDSDLSYLPLGAHPVTELAESFEVAGEPVVYDIYLPDGVRGPVAVALPGAFVTADRYRWLGTTLASHGVATFIPHPANDFVTSDYTVDLLAALADDDRVDASRLLLVGHSAGALPHVGLTDPSACAVGFCSPEHATPRALRGLVLLGFHNQNTLSDETPMAAVESPWLILNGTRDGLATPEKTDVTVDRIQDRPLYRIDIVGANHYQMTDYVDLEADLRLDDDLVPTVGNREARQAAATYMAAFARRHVLDDASVGGDLGSSGDERVSAAIRDARISPPDGHGLPRVLSEPLSMAGLDDDGSNTSISASARFGDHIYLLVRNDATGAQVWRIAEDGSAERVPFADGHVGGFYGNTRLNGLLGDMAVYNGELYVGASSGFQGSRHASTGAELWAYDGASWRPVVSNRVDADLRITVDSCDAPSDTSTAILTLSGANLTPDSLVGGAVDNIDITLGLVGDAEPNILRIVGNTATTITVQRDDIAREDEDTTCDGIGKGTLFDARVGADENGFGQHWNKAIAAIEVLGDRLYVGSGFDYADGAELYVSDDGQTFDVAVSQEFFGRHENGQPISSSISGMFTSSIGGEETLYVGTTGTDDYGARLLAITEDDISYVVDDSVDDDDTGLDEGGMSHGLHQVVSMAEFQDRLWISVMSFSGLEIFSSPTPRDASTWRVEVGAGSAFEPGWGDSSQLAARLRVSGGELWVSSTAFIQHKSELAEKSGTAWRTANGRDWQLVTAHAFGVNAVSVVDIFELGQQRIAATARGSLTSARSYGGLRLYTLD